MDNMEHNEFLDQNRSGDDMNVSAAPEETTAPQAAYEQPAYEAPAEPAYEAPAAPVNQPPVYQTPTQPAYQPAQPVYGYANAAAPKKEKKKSGGAGKALLAVILAVVIAAGSSFLTYVLLEEHSDDQWRDEFQMHQEVIENQLDVIRQEQASQTGGNAQQTNPQVPATDGLTPAQVYANNVGAVVAIANEGVSTNIYGQISRTASSGSGFIISADGYVVSNYHVVEGAETLTVIMSDGTEYTAELIGYDETNDVSLMKIEAENLPFTTLGNSSELVVGDQVCAIGNPLGELTSTLTVGYISAKDRQITTTGGAINMLQTDAAINSGNSGGPLFNTKGEVIGINTAKYSGTSNSGATIEGIGFAIPIDDVKDILSDLKEYGYVTSAYLGVEVRDVDSSGVSYGLPEGAFVQSTVAGGPAAEAGIESRDIIVNFGGHDIASVSDLLKALRKVEIGQETTVTVYRSGQNVNLKIVPVAKPQGNS